MRVPKRLPNGLTPEQDAAFYRLAEAIADWRERRKCWRHDYNAREYVCRCNPPIEGDTGFEDGAR